MPIPDRPWDIVSVAFISELPNAHGYDTIMNVVDLGTKQVHFMATHTVVSAEGAARLFLNHVWKLHGLPCTVVSDRRPQFIANFMRELYRILGIKVAVRARPCEVVEVSTEPSKRCEVFERLFEMLQTSSRGNPKLIYRQNKVKVQRQT